MFRRILVPVDGSETSSQAVLFALQMARESDGRILLVHALDTLAPDASHSYGARLRRVRCEEGERILGRALAIADDAEIAAQTRLLDQPQRRLGELVADEARAWPADLVVIGTHGRHGMARALLGSGAEEVIRMAPVPVLVLRAPA